MAYGGSPLIIQQNTQVLVTAPSFLINYKLDLFKGIQTLVFDEADMLTSTQQRQMIHLLNYFSNPAEDNTLPNKLKRRIKNNAKFQKDKPETPPQFLFVGATIPSIARGSPFSFIQTYVPDVKHIQTDSTHRTVETLETEFIECSEEEKLTNLVKVMNSETRKLLQRTGSGDAESSDLTHAAGTRPFKVLIFVNNVDKADEVFGFLCNNQMGQEVVNDAAGIEQFSPTYIDSKLTVGKLHGYIPIKERLELLDKFRNGTCNVLVTTDVSSRGLDLPNVTLVVQYDFAANITDVLHRVGRTARAGSNGKGK